VAQTVTHPLPPPTRPVAREFSAYRTGGGRWTLEVHDPAAGRVELMGDFTHWQAVALHRSDEGRWTVTLPIEPGTHRLNLRVDGGAWGVPPGLPILTDEFGGVVALLTLE
jgi:hypothetical protein